MTAEQPWQGEKGVRFTAVGLCLLPGLSAVAAGLALLLRPDGSLLKASHWLLRHTPFADFFWPGFLLFAVIGLGNLQAAILLASRRGAAAEVAAFVAATAVVVWICTEMVLVGTSHWLQLPYLVSATTTMVMVLKLRQMRQEASQETAGFGGV